MADLNTPWKHWHIGAANNNDVLLFGINVGRGPDHDEEIARYIVAAVNACTDASLSVEDLEAGAVAAQHDALNWLVYLAHDVGKDGGRPKPGEWEAAFEAGEQALAPFDTE